MKFIVIEAHRFLLSSLTLVVSAKVFDDTMIVDVICSHCHMIVCQFTNDFYPTKFLLYYKVCSILKNALNFLPDFLQMELIRNTFFCEILVFHYCSICGCLLFSRPTELNLSFSFSSSTLQTKEQKTFFFYLLNFSAWDEMMCF